MAGRDNNADNLYEVARELRAHDGYDMKRKLAASCGEPNYPPMRSSKGVGRFHAVKPSAKFEAQSFLCAVDKALGCLSVERRSSLLAERIGAAKKALCH